MQEAVSDEVRRNIRRLGPVTENRCKCCLERKWLDGEFCEKCAKLGVH